MEQNKATQLVERKKGGFRTMPFIIGDDPFLYIHTCIYIYIYIYILKIMVFLFYNVV